MRRIGDRPAAEQHGDVTRRMDRLDGLGHDVIFHGDRDGDADGSGLFLVRDDLDGSADTIPPAFQTLEDATASRKILVIAGVTESKLGPRDRFRKLGIDIARIFDAAIFIGDTAEHGVRGAIAGGMRPDQAHAFYSLDDAEHFLKEELRPGDLVLLKGGMAGHVRFGASTGGAVVILGAIMLVTAIFLSGSVGTLLRLFPPSILGVILFLTGAQLALGSCDISKDKGERFVTVITAALAVWNVGIAFVVGVTAYALNKRGWLRV